MLGDCFLNFIVGDENGRVPLSPTKKGRASRPQMVNLK